MKKAAVPSILVAVVMLAFAVIGETQQATKKIPVLGVLRSESPSVHASEHEVFQQGLRSLGYVVGQNILIEYRYAQGKVDRLPELAAELVRLRVDVIVVAGGRATVVAKQTTSTIPIVVASAGDLVGTGVVASLAKPGGNITGSTNVDADFSAKRFEILKESFPKLSRVAIVSFEGEYGDQDELRETRAAARPLGVRIQSLEIKDPSQIQAAFAAMTKERAEAVIIINNTFTFLHRKQLLELTAKNRLQPCAGGQLLSTMVALSPMEPADLIRGGAPPSSSTRS
jgi:putative tryptophan/tyrosine transport system substrate-binding protein